MIFRTAQVVAEQAHDQIGRTLSGATGGSLVFGLTIGQLNQYLQAGAFITTMIVGVAAFCYYRAKTREISRTLKKDPPNEDQ